MIVLALDTTIRGGSCALARDGVVVTEMAGDAGISQAARLPRELMALLDRAGASLRDIDVFAVAVGPGSFTGLRVGIATMQGLAFAEGRPLVGVSTFDALAAIGASGPQHSPGGSTDQAPPAVRIATWVDAWRGDVFAAVYEGGREVEPPVVAHPDELLARCGAATLFIGDGAARHRDVIRTTLGGRATIADPADPPLAGAIAARAAARAAAGELPPPHAIRPLYVRRSDAELARMARDAGTSH
jgi:tRNA threonylcarbamoyladenosine biosynthesis protein TsaB